MEYTEAKNRNKGRTTTIGLLLIVLLSTLCQVGDFRFPTIHISLNVVVVCITAILALNLTFNRDVTFKLSILGIDTISRVLLVGFVYMTIVSFAYGVDEYFADYYASVFALLMYTWISNKKIDKINYLRVAEVFLAIVYVQIAITSLGNITAGTQLYLLKSQILTPLGASNYLTTFMILFLPSVYKLERNKIVRGIFVYGMFAVILMTRSNSGIAVYIITIAVLLIISEKKFKVLRIMLASIAGIGVIYFVMSRMPEYMERFTNAFSALFGRTAGYTMNGRQAIYQTALELIKEKPIFGYGVGYRGINTNLQLHTHNWILENLLRGGGTVSSVRMYSLYLHHSDSAKQDSEYHQ